MRKVIWTLNDKELDEIRQLYEKKIALENLVKILNPENEAMYNKVINDYSTVSSRFHNWWHDMSKKYNWESIENGKWSVDFDTSEVILVET